jgi:hypothetical protein
MGRRCEEKTSREEKYSGDGIHARREKRRSQWQDAAGTKKRGMKTNFKERNKSTDDLNVEHVQYIRKFAEHR